jgi:hydroxymethylbilane synthase
VRSSASLRIGSRGSQLALWQANHLAAQLRERGHAVEIEIIHTTGDKITNVALAMVGTKGMFTKEIEEALAAGAVDLAVHSLKDLPTELPAGFEIAAITTRQDPRDAFCSLHFKTIAELPHGARVGTSSLRRQAQLKSIRPDLEVHPLRGNVDTRLRKLEQGDYAAIILAAAGLNRLGKTEHIQQIIPAGIMCPAAGQGALAIEIREGDTEMREQLAFLDDPSARATTTCERAMLASMGGGCQVPIGALAIVLDRAIPAAPIAHDRPAYGGPAPAGPAYDGPAYGIDPAAERRQTTAHGVSRGSRAPLREGALAPALDGPAYAIDPAAERQQNTAHGVSRGSVAPHREGASAPPLQLHLEAIVASPDGTQILREARDGNDPEKLGQEVGHALLARGGDKILEAVYTRGFAVPPQP